MDVLKHQDSPLTVSNSQRILFTVDPPSESGLYGCRGTQVGGYFDQDAIMTHVRIMLEQQPKLRVEGRWTSLL